MFQRNTLAFFFDDPGGRKIQPCVFRNTRNIQCVNEAGCWRVALTPMDRRAALERETPGGFPPGVLDTMPKFTYFGA